MILGATATRSGLDSIWCSAYKRASRRKLRGPDDPIRQLHLPRGLHPQVLRAVGHDHETHKNGAPNNSGFKLTGFSKLIQTKPISDYFSVKQFYNVEFLCIDVTTIAHCFLGGCTCVAKSNMSMGNSTHTFSALDSSTSFPWKKRSSGSGFKISFN